MLVPRQEVFEDVAHRHERRTGHREADTTCVA